MRVALVNPPWSFEGSIYFGCREPHLPLELGYARALLHQRGHAVRLFDAQLDALELDALTQDVAEFRPDVTVLTTAPSYLFWRCAPPELRVPMATARALRPHTGRMIGVGPHASTTPRAALRKLGVDAVVLGECEQVLVELVEAAPSDYEKLDSIAYREEGSREESSRGEGSREESSRGEGSGEESSGDEGAIIVRGTPASTDMSALPPLRWKPSELSRHQHHHHRFDRAPCGPGAEIEASRGCPYACTFCAKENFRNRYRKRPLEVVLDELDGLIAGGARYVYFIDEIFLPDRALLEALVDRDVEIGVQLRIDNWSHELLELLGRAGCVSIEAGVESITPEGRRSLNKRCKLSTAELTELLIHAKRHVPFVQANLIGTSDDRADVATWRATLSEHGVWSNEPVPLFPYPGSPEYRQRWGALDDDAWERAHARYLSDTEGFSDIQEQRPLPLAALER